MTTVQSFWALGHSTSTDKVLSLRLLKTSNENQSSDTSSKRNPVFNNILLIFLTIHGHFTKTLSSATIRLTWTHYQHGELRLRKYVFSAHLKYRRNFVKMIEENRGLSTFGRSISVTSPCLAWPTFMLMNITWLSYSKFWFYFDSRRKFARIVLKTKIRKKEMERTEQEPKGDNQGKSPRKKLGRSFFEFCRNLVGTNRCIFASSRDVRTAWVPRTLEHADWLKTRTFSAAGVGLSEWCISPGVLGHIGVN